MCGCWVRRAGIEAGSSRSTTWGAARRGTRSRGASWTGAAPWSWATTRSTGGSLFLAKVMVVTTRAVLLQDERGHGGGAGRLGVLPGPRHQEAEAGPAPAAEEGEAPQHQGLVGTQSPVSQKHRVES